MSVRVSRTYGGVHCAIGGSFNPALPPNKSLKPNAYRRDFQPHITSKGFDKCTLPCWPGIGLAQALGGSSKSLMGNPDFYNKVANKFGGYRSGAQRITEYPGQNPDQVFDQKLLAVAGNDSCVLDVGCADGRNILRIAHHFKQVYAIDLSDSMLEVARTNQTAAGITNVIFEKQDAARTTFPNEFFDAVGSRRGPAFYAEYFRVLKPGGYFVHTFIGEQDAKALKKIFGRGQNFGQWDRSFRQEEQQRVEQAGLDLIYVEDFYFNQYYATFDDFNLFLQSVPIFEDFDSKKDRTYVETYVQNFQTAKGIQLPRHILVSMAKKI